MALVQETENQEMKFVRIFITMSFNTAPNPPPVDLQGLKLEVSADVSSLIKFGMYSYAS